MEVKIEIVGYRPSTPAGPTSAMPVVDLPIAREGLIEEDFIVPTWSEFAKAVEEDHNQQIDRDFLKTDQVPTLAASEIPIAQAGMLQELHRKLRLAIAVLSYSNKQLSLNNSGLQSDSEVQTYQQQLLGSIGPTMYSLRVLPEGCGKIWNYSISVTPNNAESNATCRNSESVKDEEEQSKESECFNFQAVQQSRPSSSLADADIAIQPERLPNDNSVSTTCCKFGDPGKCDSDLSQVRKWLESNQVPNKSCNQLIVSVTETEQLSSSTDNSRLATRPAKMNSEISRTSCVLRVNNSRTHSLMLFSIGIPIKLECATAGVDQLGSNSITTESPNPSTLSAEYDSCRPRRNSEQKVQTCNLQQSQLLGPIPVTPKTTYSQFQQHSIFSTYSTSSTHSTGESDAPNCNIEISEKEGEKSEFIDFQASRTPGPSNETTRSRSPQSSNIQHYSTSGTPRCAESNESSCDSENSRADGGKEKEIGYSTFQFFEFTVSLPVVDLPLRSVINFFLSTWREITCAMTAIPDFQFVKNWLETYQVPTPDALSTRSANSRGFAQHRASLALREHIIVWLRENDQHRVLIVVTDGSVPRRNASGSGERFAMDSVGCQSSFPLMARVKRCALIVINFSARNAISVLLFDQTSNSIIYCNGTTLSILILKASSFNSESLQNLCNLSFIHQIFSSVNHFTSIGIFKIFNLMFQFRFCAILNTHTVCNFYFVAFIYNRAHNILLFRLRLTFCSFEQRFLFQQSSFLA